jgi:hypothetical protein
MIRVIFVPGIVTEVISRKKRAFVVVYLGPVEEYSWAWSWSVVRVGKACGRPIRCARWRVAVLDGVEVPDLPDGDSLRVGDVLCDYVLQGDEEAVFLAFVEIVRVWRL